MGAKITDVNCIIITGFVTCELQRISYCPKALLEVGLRVEISVYFILNLYFLVHFYSIFLSYQEQLALQLMKKLQRSA